MNKVISIAIHGGAGTIPKGTLSEEQEAAYHLGLQSALDVGYQILACGGTSLDAVAAAVKSLEDCPLFNAGKGAVFTQDGTHEMDASIMRGDNLEAGAACGITGVKNPIILAKTILEKSDHVLLSGRGAEKFAKLQGLEFEDEAYFFNEYRHKQWLEVKDSDTTRMDHSLPNEKKMGTVGAVALDEFGNLAAATSTGGMTNKKYGRIGDTPLIGAGTYANNESCAISCTGHGEMFIRTVVAFDIASLMNYRKLSLKEACFEVVHKKLPLIQGEGGVIAIDKVGNIELCFNSEGMYRGMKNNLGIDKTLIYREDD